MGGIILCPVPGCRCFWTWTPAGPGMPELGSDDVYVPPMDDIEDLRAQFQEEET